MPTVTRRLLRHTWRRLNPPTLEGLTLRLGYVFHTERLHRDPDYACLLDFCQRFRALTGRDAICLVTPPSAPLLAGDLASARFPGERYADKVRELSRHARIGYHGHFTLDPDHGTIPLFNVLAPTAVMGAVRDQVEQDLTWFEAAGIDHGGLYAGGWWFQHPELVRILIDRGFRADFSVSPYPYLYNRFSAALLRDHRIPGGASFRLRQEGGGGSLLMVQNLVPCHHTPFPEDFVRYLRRVVTPGHPDLVGVVHSHDYALPAHMDDTLRCIEFLLAGGARFLDAEELVALGAEREVVLA